MSQICPSTSWVFRPEHASSFRAASDKRVQSSQFRLRFDDRCHLEILSPSLHFTLSTQKKLVHATDTELRNFLPKHPSAPRTRSTVHKTRGHGSGELFATTASVPVPSNTFSPKALPMLPRLPPFCSWGHKSTSRTPKVSRQSPCSPRALLKGTVLVHISTSTADTSSVLHLKPPSPLPATHAAPTSTCLGACSHALPHLDECPRAIVIQDPKLRSSPQFTVSASGSVHPRPLSLACGRRLLCGPLSKRLRPRFLSA